MVISVLRVAAAFFIAWIFGIMASKIKLPSILGWLIAGMLLGPHAFQLLDTAVLNAAWFQGAVHVLECGVGLMIGTEIIWRTMKKSGAQVLVTTLTESFGTFVVVTLTFAAIFAIEGIPIYLSAVFGSIALATAPAPSLSIVREFKTDGPVTRTLIPMAALDDIVGVVVFFTVMSVVSARVSAEAMPLWVIVMTPLLPLLIGGLIGIPAGFILKKVKKPKAALAVLLGFILVCAGVGFLCNQFVMPEPVLNFMLIGMAFSAVFANILPEEQLDSLLKEYNPILGFALIIVILNLGAPLDYHLILGAGLFTAIYIISRAIGKYTGALWGAAMTKSPPTLKKYLGFTLLPHSGVSLVFTGIAVTTLTPAAPEEARIIQGTIAAAAVINEVIAVILAKKGFEWAGELNKKTDEVQ